MPRDRRRSPTLCRHHRHPLFQREAPSAAHEPNGATPVARPETLYLPCGIFKECQAQKGAHLPARPSARTVADMMRFTTTGGAPLSSGAISGHHVREAGSTAAQELGLTPANGVAYVEA